MKNTDLRVGNWVSLYGKFEKVESIGTYGVSFKNGFAKYTLPNLKPIPLTEEILLSCGFEKVRYEKYAHNKLNKLRAYPHVMKDDFGIYLMGSYTLPNIKYLHQLQNLYHALTGQELKIEL